MRRGPPESACSKAATGVENARQPRAPQGRPGGAAFCELGAGGGAVSGGVEAVAAAVTAGGVGVAGAFGFAPQPASAESTAVPSTRSSMPERTTLALSSCSTVVRRLSLFGLGFASLVCWLGCQSAPAPALEGEPGEKRFHTSLSQHADFLTLLELAKGVIDMGLVSFLGEK